MVETMKSLVVLALPWLSACSATPEPGTAPSSAAPEPRASAAAAPERTDRGWAKAATGCGDFHVQVSHASKRRFLVIGSNRKALGLVKVGDTKTLTLPDATKALDLNVSLYDAPGGDQTFCNDVVPAAAPTRTASLLPASGTITVKLTALASEHDFSVEITLTGVTVRNEDVLEPVPDATYADVRVGWLPG